MSAIRRKDLPVYTGLIYALLCLINGCAGESNSEDLQVQLNDLRRNADQNEKEKYFESKQEEISCAKDKGGCKLTMQMNGCIWGYEDGCTSEQRYMEPICKDVEGYRPFRSMKDRIDAFWDENDFGFVKNAKKLNLICEPSNEDDSSFECNEQLTLCRGKNIFMDFTYNGRSIYEKMEKRPFEQGKFGGYCKLAPDQFKGKNIYRGKLRSWAANDIDHFASLPFKPSDPNNCDVVVNDPTIFVDLDFAGSLYHHFCDFFNLYLTLHANNSLYSTFDVAKWDALEHLGPFGDTWKAFTKNVYPLWLKYRDKKVCFKDVVFGLLPRMAYGLYYSTPLVEGCSRSGMFKAFSEYILDGLNISRKRKAKADLLRVTLLYRTTEFRRIVNQDELIKVMKSTPGITVQSVDFNWDMPFLEQLAISSNSDIFIGIHGAGLAHTLFLPDWAVLFELYNTEDVHCYKDLARLRGVTYITWEKKEKLKDETDDPHPNYTYEKFRNYRFDVDEFQRLLNVAIEQAKENIKVANL